ncbi:MAG: hypothetical protein JRI25_16435 [Deltaproteobacteria bacterium]|nr:hypothetical protein [Deltaproteobacteria bacterium]
MANTYFDLPPEMGGTQFGPFSGAVQIGTDPGQCQIVLAQSMGIAPVHVTIADQKDGQYVVAPAQKGFGLFMIKAGTQNMSPIASTVMATSGDTIIVGPPTGPRFTIRRMEGPALGAAGGGGGGRRQGGMGSSVASELWRVQMARLMARNRMFRDVSHMMYRYRTGALTNPRVLVGLIGGAGAFLAVILASCGGLIAWFLGAFS